MGPPWIAHQSAERRRGKRRMRGEGEWSRWLGTCSTHRESLALLFSPLLIAPFRLAFPLAWLSFCSSVSFLSLPSTHTKGRVRVQPPFPPELLFTCRHTCTYRGNMWPGVGVLVGAPQQSAYEVHTWKHPYQLLLVPFRHFHLLALYFLLHIFTLMFSLGGSLLNSSCFDVDPSTFALVVCFGSVPWRRFHHQPGLRFWSLQKVFLNKLFCI